MNKPDAMPHDEAIELLPWLVNASLTAQEHEAVTAHATACVICRRELGELKVLQSAIRQPSGPMEAPAVDMRRINARIDAQLERDTRAARFVAMLRDFLHSPWRIVFAAQSVVLVVLAAMLLQADNGEPQFVTLTTPATLPAGHYVRVVFDPTVDAADIGVLLQGLELRVIDGPTERGVYTLQYAAGQRDSDRERTVTALRADQRVLFAEAVTSSDR